MSNHYDRNCEQQFERVVEKQAVEKCSSCQKEQQERDRKALMELKIAVAEAKAREIKSRVPSVDQTFRDILRTIDDLKERVSYLESLQYRVDLPEGITVDTLKASEGFNSEKPIHGLSFRPVK